MTRVKHWFGIVWLALALTLGAGLSACGGSGGDTGAAAGGGTTPAASGGSATIDAQGGTLVSAEGVKVVVPAGAASAPVTIRVAKDATGAPALPATGLKAAGDVYAITPHGQTFSRGVTVSLPAPSVTLAANEQLVLAKAEQGGNDWVLQPTTLQDGMLQTTVRSFSFVLPVVVSFPQPLASLPPLAVDQVTELCNDMPCSSYFAGMAAGTLTDPPGKFNYSFRSNGGQLPAGCTTPTIELTVGKVLTIAGQEMALSWSYPAFGTDSGVKTAELALPYPTNTVGRTLMLVCGGVPRQLLAGPAWTYFPWPAGAPATGSGTIAIAAWPGALTAVSGHSTFLPATLLMQGVSVSPSLSRFPNSDLQTLVRWERSDDSGASWQQVATTQQIDAAVKAYVINASHGWGFWLASHGFKPSPTDNGSKWRLTACWHDATLTTPDPCVTSGSLTLTVIDNGLPPAFTQQPRDMLVTTGQTASFSAVADPSNGLPVTGWQWQTRPANSSGVWSDIAGATAATYTTGVLGTANNGTQFRVLATNAAGSTASDTVTASVGDTAVAPSVTAQPLGLAVLTGSDAVFAVAARGTEALSYQWLKNGSPIDSRSNASAASPMLRLPAAALADAADYSVQVSNAVGSVTSQAAHLGVANAVPAVQAPSIVSAPANAAVHVGDSASFGVGVGGTGPFSYQWFAGSTAIPGATQAVFTLPAVAANDAGPYHVTVSNSAGSVDSAAATLAVSALGAPASAPAITTDPATVTALPQTVAVFAVAASGSGPLSYQWSVNGTPLVDGGNIAGATSPVLMVGGVTVAQAGTYRVRVSNAAGAVQSAAAQLVVVGAPTFAAQPSDASVNEGDVATFSANAVGSFVGYQWLLNGEPIIGATGPSYTTPGTALSDSGSTYRVLAYNNAGVVFSRSAVLTVNPAPAACTANCVTPLASGLGLLSGLAVDSQGTAYTFDRLSYRVLAISPSGVVRTVAGTGSLGAANGTGTAASFVGTAGVSLAVDAADNLYVSQNEGLPAGNSDPNNCNAYTVRKITPAGEVSTLRPCQGANGVATADGTTVYLSAPTVYANHAPANVVTKLVNGQLAGWGAGASNGSSGYADGAGTAAAFNDVRGLALDPAGFLVVADTGNCALRKLTLGATASTLAGGPSRCGSSDGSLANAQFNAPSAVAVAGLGSYYVADAGLVRAVDLNGGSVTTVSGTGSQSSGAATSVGFPAGIGGLAWAGSQLYIASGDRVVVLTP